MNDDKPESEHVIRIDSEEDRRRYERRRNDVRVIEQAAELMARERRYLMFKAAYTIMAGDAANGNGIAAPAAYADLAELLYEEIERREKERKEQE